MALILAIETSSATCSVAINKNRKVIAVIKNTTPNSHSSLLSVITNNILSENNLSAIDFDAFAVSIGPGSYTGLRIGTSLIKGLAFGAEKPVIAVSTLKSVAYSCLLKNNVNKISKNTLLIPVIDARRDEVYAAIYDLKLNEILSPLPIVVTSNTFTEYSLKNKLIFIGNGAEKCKNILKFKNAEYFPEIYPSAEAVSDIAQDMYKAKQFVNVAYFEPMYLKDFIAIKSSKKLF